MRTERYVAKRNRQQKAERDKARAERERQAEAKRRQAEWAEQARIEHRTVGGLDFYKEAERIWRLPYMCSLPLWSEQMPNVNLHRSNSKWFTSGHAFMRSTVHVTVGLDHGDGLATLMHELVHCVTRTGRYASGKRDVHTEQFWTVCRCLAREAYPDATFRFNEPARTDRAKHDQIADGMRGWLKSRS